MKAKCGAKSETTTLRNNCFVIVESLLTFIEYIFIMSMYFLISANSDAFSWPKDWKKWQGGSNYDKDVVPTTVTNQHFINWMNVAAFPFFTKLYAKIKLEPGEYTLHVFYSILCLPIIILGCRGLPKCFYYTGKLPAHR